MHLCVFEDEKVDHLLPLVHTRAVYDLRLGIRTLLETTRDAFDATGTVLHARPQVAAVTGQENDLLVNRIPDGLDVLFVNGRYVAADGPVLERLQGAARPDEPARAFVQGDDLVAAWVPDAGSRYVGEEAVTRATFEGLPEEEVEGAVLVGRLWHLLDGLHEAVERDYRRRTNGYNILERSGADVHEAATIVGGERVYVAPGASVRPGAVLDAEEGPVYVGEQATVFENAVVRGPAYVGPFSQVKVGAHIDGSVLGTWTKAGGEVEGTIIHSYSNKAHPGFLGDSYLGRWCNLGADTNTSNLKNDYGEVTLYDAVDGDFVGTGRQFVGLFMGDHSKTSINTMLNTGTVVGVCCNLFGHAFPPRRIPSFSWGGAASGFAEYRLDKAMEVAEAVMARRDVAFTEADREMLRVVFEATQAEREAAS